MIMTKTEMKKARIKECVQVLSDFGCTMIENEGVEFTFDLIMDGIHEQGSFNRYGDVYLMGAGNLGDGFSTNEREYNGMMKIIESNLQSKIDDVWMKWGEKMNS